jgi:hypothetical protein
MGEAKLKRTKTNHDMPLVRQVSRTEADFVVDAITSAPPVTNGRHEVAKVGMLATGQAFIQDTDYAYYKLPNELRPWAKGIIPYGLSRVITFPCPIEFGYDQGRPWVEFII